MAASIPTITSASGTASPPALTTIFSPSPSCTIDLYRSHRTDIKCVGGDGETITCFYFHLGPLQSTSACFPSGWQPETSRYFSPGICPFGYETACSSVVSVDSLTETRATCCPRNYGCQTGDQYPWYTSDLCTILDPESGTFVYTTSTPGIGFVATTETGRYAFNAYGIEIRWKSADFVSDTTTASLTVITSSPGSPESGQSTPGTSDTHQAGADVTDLSSGNLATSAIIGIGVGVGIGGLLLVSVLVYWLLRRHRRKLPSATSGVPEIAPYLEPAKTWMEPQELPAHHEPAQPQELDSKPK